MTNSVTARATATVPVMFDYGPFPGDPDVASRAGTVSTSVFPSGRAATPVTPGLWDAVPSEVGPFPAGGAPRATAAMSMSAVMQAFDTSANSAPGDFWRSGVQSLAATASYNVLVVNPGQTRTIDLSVRPSGGLGGLGGAGTVVKGVLYIDDFVDSLQFLSGSQLAALPYEYTIG